MGCCCNITNVDSNCVCDIGGSIRRPRAAMKEGKEMDDAVYYVIVCFVLLYYLCQCTIFRILFAFFGIFSIFANILRYFCFANFASFANIWRLRHIKIPQTVHRSLCITDASNPCRKVQGISDIVNILKLNGIN